MNPRTETTDLELTEVPAMAFGGDTWQLCWNLLWIQIACEFTYGGGYVLIGSGGGSYALAKAHTEVANGTF